MRFTFLFFLLCLCSEKAFEQSLSGSYRIHFAVYDGSQKIIPDPEHYLQNDTSKIALKQMKFYVSDIQLRDINGKEYHEPQSYHLIELGHQDNITVSIPSDFNPSLCTFHLGIDSLINVSGIMTGDLDPMNGMYWTWQSGYINIKLEGVINGNKEQADFEYHLGGYAGSHLAMQTFSATNKGHELFVHIDLSDFFKHFDYQQVKHIMTPGKNAVMLSGLLIHCFKSSGND